MEGLARLLKDTGYRVSEPSHGTVIGVKRVEHHTLCIEVDSQWGIASLRVSGAMGSSHAELYGSPDEIAPKILAVAERVEKLLRKLWLEPAPSSRGDGLVLGLVSEPRIRISVGPDRVTMWAEAAIHPDSASVIEEGLRGEGVVVQRLRDIAVARVEYSTSLSTDEILDRFGALLRIIEGIDSASRGVEEEIGKSIVATFEQLVNSAVGAKKLAAHPATVRRVLRMLRVEKPSYSCLARRVAELGMVRVVGRDIEVCGIRASESRSALALAIEAGKRYPPLGARIADAALDNEELARLLVTKFGEHYVSPMCVAALRRESYDAAYTLKRLLFEPPQGMDRFGAAKLDMEIARYLVGTILDDVALAAMVAEGLREHPRLVCRSDRCRELVLFPTVYVPEIDSIEFAVKVPGTTVAIPVIAYDAEEAAERIVAERATALMYIEALGSADPMIKALNALTGGRAVLKPTALPGSLMGIARIGIGRAGEKEMAIDALDPRTVEALIGEPDTV